MTTYIIRRLIRAVLIVWAISAITFTMFYVLPPGDPAQRMAGKNPTPEQIEKVRKKFNLDKPLPVQYVTMMKQIATGELISFTQQVKVVPVVLRSIPVTLSLAAIAGLLWLAIGVGVGIAGAKRPGSVLDRSLMIAALAGLSVPMAWLSLYSLKIWTDSVPLFPAGGYVAIAEGGPFEWLRHVLLPAATLSVVFAGVYARMTRTNIEQATRAEHVKTAVAKGLPQSQVFRSHVLRTGLIPIIVLFGLDFGALVGGAIFTETIFGLPGLGAVARQAINTFDIPILIVWTMFAATCVVIANIVADVIQAAVDPRIRLA